MQGESAYRIVWDSGPGGRMIHELPGPILEAIVKNLGKGITICRRKLDGVWGIAWPDGCEAGNRARDCVAWPESARVTTIEELCELADLAPGVVGSCKLACCPSRWCKHAKTDMLALWWSVAQAAAPAAREFSDAALLACRHPLCADALGGAAFQLVATRTDWLLVDRADGGRVDPLHGDLHEMANTLVNLVTGKDRSSEGSLASAATSAA